MRRRLWRDPVPPRRLKPDYPAWLQEIVLRCLEIEPAWRHPTAAQLAFNLSHPSEVKLTARSERLRRDPLTTVLRRRFNKDLTRPRAKPALAAQLASAPIVAVAIDLAEGANLSTMRCASPPAHSRDAAVGTACVPQRAQAGPDHPRHHARRAWSQQAHRPSGCAQALGRAAEAGGAPAHRACDRGIDPAAAILEFAHANRVDHILIGARQNSLMRKLLGSVSAKVAAESPCTVTIVREARVEETAQSAPRRSD